jgi:2-phospho-L-lactate guanylyltransferase (CobY/MobA/RfbA family)
MGMSVMAVAGSETRSNVAAASLLTTSKAGDEYLSTDAVTLADQNFAVEEYQPEDAEEDLNLASARILDILEQSRDLP